MDGWRRDLVTRRVQHVRWGNLVRLTRGASEYVPVGIGTPLERVLVAHFSATFALSDALTRHSQEEGNLSRRGAARRFVQRIWGPEPDLETRFGFRQMLHAQLLGSFFVCGVISAGLIAVGRALDVGPVRGAGVALLLVACVFLGAHGPVAVRTMCMEWDARAWISAGRPAAWRPRRCSQLRCGDLFWASCLTAVWASFFYVLIRPSL